jgi:hypothetical protein
MQIAKVRKMPLEGEKVREKVVDVIGKRIIKLKFLESSP